MIIVLSGSAKTFNVIIRKYVLCWRKYFVSMLCGRSTMFVVRSYVAGKELAKVYEDILNQIPENILTGLGF